MFLQLYLQNFPCRKWGEFHHWDDFYFYEFVELGQEKKCFYSLLNHTIAIFLFISRRYTLLGDML